MDLDSEHEQYEGTQCTGGIFGSTRPALSGAGEKSNLLLNIHHLYMLLALGLVNLKYI